jgi:hypothetical protein
MSVSLIKDVLQLPREVANTHEKMVLIAIAQHVNESRDDKTAWPSNNTIAKQTSMSRNGVISTRSRLESRGFLKKVSTGGSRKGEKRSSNRYLITLPVVHPVHHSADDQCTTSTAPVHAMHQTSAPDAPVPVHHVHANSKTNDGAHEN